MNSFNFNEGISNFRFIWPTESSERQYAVVVVSLLKIETKKWEQKLFF